MELTLQELATIYAVALSTILAISEWKRRHAAHVSYFVGREISSKRNDKLSLVVTFTNRGSSRTTVKALHFRHWKSQISYLFRKKPITFFVKLDNLLESIDPGCIWQAQAIYDEETEELFNSGITQICVNHSMASKPAIKRIAKKGS